MKKRLPVVMTEELSLRVQRNTSYRMLLADEPIADLATNASAFADKLYETMPQRREVECRKGCSFCCHIGVSCTTPEAIAVANYIRALAPEEREPIQTRLIEREDMTRGRTKEEQFSSHIPCAFLGDDGACAVYRVRPLQCRSWNSLDRSSCESAFNSRDPAATTSIHGPARKIINAVMVGMAAGVEDAGLDGRSMRLMSAVRALLEDETLGERWAAARRLPDALLEPSAPARGQYGTLEENDAVLKATFGH
jgi:Fe-S-cluster containining protein